MTGTEAKWTERVREWRASAQTADEFAQGRGFEASTLRYWASRLRAKAPTVAAPSSSAGTGNASAEPGRGDTLRFVRVRRSRVSTSNGTTAPAGGSALSAPMLVAVGNARIEVRVGFDRGLLREVVEALGGPR